MAARRRRNQRRRTTGIGQNQVNEDIKVADDTRGRRRRNRRRKRMRAEAARAININQSESTVARRRRIPRGPRNGQHLELEALLSEEAKVFFESVSHPFSQEAPGAMLPDGKGDSVLPAMDRWTLDVPPGFYDNTTSTTIGLAVAILPRCLTAGWLAGKTLSGIGNENRTILDLPIGFLNSGMDPIAPNSDLPIGNLCSVLMFGINQLGNCFRIGADGASVARNTGINIISMSRTESFNSNTENARLLGAGLKIFSDEAPINTGGTCYGGAIPANELYQLCVKSVTGAVPGQVGNLEKALLHRVDLQGLDGSTTRYNPFQDPGRQLDYVKSRVSGQFTLAEDNAITNEVTINTVNNVEPGANDQMPPGCLIPICVWKWNVTGTQDERYTLRVNTRAHLEGTPSGTSPFITHKPDFQPGLGDMYALMNNRDLFPTAVAGHSFKSFISRIGHVAASVERFAAKAGKIAKIVEGFI